MRFSVFVIASMLVLSTPAAALVWPDVIEEVQSGLNAPAMQTRRAAAERIASLGLAVALPLLQKALGDPETEVRIAAAQSAIRLHANEVTEVVLPWLRERDVRLRVAACEVARSMPNAKAVAELGRALGDTESPLVRAAAAEALGAAQTTEAAAPLLGRLDDPSPNVRVQVARALAKLHDPRAVVPLVGKAQDSAPEVRQAVARALGDLGDARAGQTLIQLLRDPVLDVKLEVLTAIGRMRADSAVPTLAPLASDRTSSIRSAAITALGRIGTKDAVRVLVALLGQAEDATSSLERTPVREALVSTGDAAIPELAAALDGATGSARAASAAWVLGELRAKKEAPRVIAALRRGSISSAAALHALAGCGSAESIPIVLEYLADASPVVRAEAMGAAGALLDPSKPDGRAVEPLVAALRARALTDAERASLARLLGRTGAPRAAPSLTALLGAREPSLRLAAIVALGQLGPAGADDALLSLLREPDAEVRLRTAVALSTAGGERSREALLGWIDGGDGIDRAAVVTALAGVLARAPSPAATERVRRSLELSAGGDRDALLVVLGRSPAGTTALRDVAEHGDDDDRRTVASVVGAVVEGPRLNLLKVLLADRDATVQAQAAWSAAAFPAAAVQADLEKLLRVADADVACNAMGALARVVPISARAPLFCAALTDARPLVRANALAAIARGQTCDPARVRALLANDTSIDVRIAAARATWARTTPEARAELAECAASDRSPRVARACVERPATSTATRSPVEVFVVPYGATSPKARAPYVLEIPDGTLRCGAADRRGAIVEPAAPAGELTLRRP